MYYCSDSDEEYQLNVLEKIKKLSYKIKLWSQRHLTMEGKTLIVKTFGLSQIIYNMQSYGFKNAELINTERIIFKFLWSAKENPNGIDRINEQLWRMITQTVGWRLQMLKVWTDLLSLNSSSELITLITSSQRSKPYSQLSQVLVIIYIKNIQM